MTRPRRKQSPPCEASKRVAELREKAEKAERENWGLPPEQRAAAVKLNSAAVELMTAVARHGGLLVGDIGGELANLSRVGFVEFAPNGDPHRSTATLSRAGALALLLRNAERAHANAPKGRPRQDNGHADDREARTAA